MTKAGAAAQCPTFEIDTFFGDCTGVDQREVTIDAHISDGTTQILDVGLFINGQEVTSADGNGMVDLYWSKTQPAGTTMQVEIRFNQPSNYPSSTYQIQVPTCSKPKVVINPYVGDCVDGVNRNVTIEAEVSGDPSQNLMADLWVHENEIPVDKATGFGQINLNWNGLLPAGSDIPVEVRIEIPPNTDSTLETVHIPGCNVYPQIGINSAIEKCDDANQRNVTINASVAMPNQEITAELRILGQVTAVVQAVGSGRVDLIWQDACPAGSEIQAEVIIIDPPNYSSESTTIIIPACDTILVEVEVPIEWPTVSINSVITPCTDENERNLEVKADIQGQAGQVIMAGLVIGGIRYPTQKGVGTVKLSGSKLVAAGSTVAVIVEFDEPAGCPPTIASINLPICEEVVVEVPVEVPVTPECPNVTTFLSFEECDEEGHRWVSVSADVVGNQVQFLEAHLSIDGSIVNTQTGEGMIQLTWSRFVRVGRPIVIDVIIDSPEGCGTNITNIVVPAC